MDDAVFKSSDDKEDVAAIMAANCSFTSPPAHSRSASAEGSAKNQNMDVAVVESVDEEHVMEIAADSSTSPACPSSTSESHAKNQNMDVAVVKSDDKEEEDVAMEMAAHSSISPACPITSAKGSATNPAQGQGQQSKNIWIASFIAFIIIIIIVVIVVVVVRNEDKDTESASEPYVPTTVNYATGVSLITDYVVNATVSSRLCQTKISMDIVNALDCSSIHSVTLQLPLDTFVVSLQTMSDNGCITHGKVDKLKDVRETFLETAAQGLPGAYIEEQDSSTYSLQVSIPPLGETRVELVLEALLQQRLGQVEFQLPVIPNEKVDRLVLDLTVEDVASDLLPTKFSLDFNGYYQDDTITPNTSSYLLDLSDAREHKLPKVLHGKYQPSEIPDNGILYMDGLCFEYYFRPATLESMKRNLVFVVDTFENQVLLKATKDALGDFIDTLTPKDTLTIQTFGRRGTEELWGSASATDEEKADAKSFVQGLKPQVTSTNLHEGILEGMLRAREDAKDSGDDTVTILMLVSDDWANQGEQRRRKIVQDVYKLNRDGRVKVFSLGVGGYADMDLLNAISMMNGGVAAPVFENGHVPMQEQMKTFFESEFGSVLLFDVGFQPNFKARGATKGSFPILSEGYEIVLRGLLLPEDSAQEGPLRILTTGYTIDGILEWNATASVLSSTSEAKNSRCFQSYAHSRIAQLMRYRDIAPLVPDEFLSEIAQLSEKCTEQPDTTLSDCIEQQALSLALEGNIVAKGFTGMATVDDDSCLPSFENETDTGICRDGTGTADYDEGAMADGGYEDYGDGMVRGGSGSYYRGYGSGFIVSFSWLMLTFLLGV